MKSVSRLYEQKAKKSLANIRFEALNWLNCVDPQNKLFREVETTHNTSAEEKRLFAQWCTHWYLVFSKTLTGDDFV